MALWIGPVSLVAFCRYNTTQTLNHFLIILYKHDNILIGKFSTAQDKIRPW